MNRNAKLFIFVLLTLGVSVIASSFAEWRPANLTKFFSVLGLAVCAAVLRVAIPKMAGDISFSLMFVMISVVDLPLPETLLIGCTTLMIESIWRPGSHPTLLQLLFALANMSLAIGCAYYVFHSALLYEQRVELPFRILIAASTCFFVNTFSVAAANSLAERLSLLKIWQERALSRYPQYVLAAVVAWAYSLVAFEVGWPAGLLILPILYLLHRTYSLYVGRLEDGKLHAEELASLHLRTIEALAGAIEAKDDNTHDHLKRVQVYALELGREFGMEDTDLEALRAAAVLHDIGKLAVPEHIISKPGRLTPEEFEKMKIHPVVGAEILERVRFPYEVAPIVRSHHERWDGTGYPSGLKGEEIPIGARILSVVDCLDALASDRQYRKALPLHEAMQRICADSGKAFDPEVVEALRRRYIELERRARTQAHAPTTAPRLSLDIKLGNNAAPAAGFAKIRRIEVPPADGVYRTTLEALTLARREISTAFDVSQPDGRSLTLSESLALLAIRMRRITPYDAIAVYLLRDGVLIPEYVHGDNYRLFSSLRIPIGQGLSGWVAENRKPLLNGNPSVEPGYLNDPKMFSTLGSALAVPLESLEGVLGVLTLYREHRDAFTPDELTMVQAAAPRVSLAIEHACAPSAEERETDTDPVTGVPGPRGLAAHIESELGRVRRLNLPLALILCKIEGLAQVKEALGAAEVSKALRNVAAAMKDSAHGFDIVARSGVDEFIVISPGLTHTAAEARLARLSHLTGFHGSYQTSVVVAAALFPEDGTRPEDLFRKADERLAIATRAAHEKRTAAKVAVLR